MIVVQGQLHNQELYEMALRHFNEPMLNLLEVVRLVGYGETGVDCYLIAMKPRGDVIWITCVGGYTFLDRLRGQNYVKSSSGEDWDDLYRLDNSLALNGCPRANEFRLEIRHDDMEGTAISEDAYDINSGSGFTDANNRQCTNLDVVEYEFGARRGIFLDATHDGDAYVMFRDTKKVEIVKWRSLCKVPAVDEA